MTNQEPPVPDVETEIVEVDVRVIIPPWLYDDFHRYHAALCEAGRPDLAAQLHVRVDETGWLVGLAQDTECVRCRRQPGKHRLRLRGMTFPGVFCCACTDDRMAALGQTVGAEEGAAGLESFRRQHLEECGWRPDGWEPTGG